MKTDKSTLVAMAVGSGVAMISTTLAIIMILAFLGWLFIPAAITAYKDTRG